VPRQSDYESLISVTVVTSAGALGVGHVYATASRGCRHQGIRVDAESQSMILLPTGQPASSAISASGMPHQHRDFIRPHQAGRVHPLVESTRGSRRYCQGAALRR